MKYILSAFPLYTVLFMLLGGCATSADPKDETLSMVYGYMGSNESLSGSMQWAKLKENRQPAAIHHLIITRTFWEKGGLFWHLGLKPGSYQLDDYGLPNVTYRYGTASKNITTIHISEPNVYYMGSFWHQDKSVFIKTGFELERTNNPTEREIVQRLIKEFETRGNNKIYARQYNLLKRRLTQLP